MHDILLCMHDSLLYKPMGFILPVLLLSMKLSLQVMLISASCYDANHWARSCIFLNTR